MGHRLALEREPTRSLACLSPPSLVQPYPIARSQTYCANVWHSRYARYSSSAGHAWLALIYVCAIPTQCARAGKGALFVTRTVNCVIGPSPLLLLLMVATVISDTICAWRYTLITYRTEARLSEWLLSSILSRLQFGRRNYVADTRWTFPFSINT